MCKSRSTRPWEQAQSTNTGETLTLPDLGKGLDTDTDEPMLASYSKIGTARAKVREVIGI